MFISDMSVVMRAEGALMADELLAPAARGEPLGSAAVSPPHTSWGWHGWLWAVLHTVEEQTCRPGPNEGPRHGHQPRPKLRIPRSHDAHLSPQALADHHLFGGPPPPQIEGGPQVEPR